MSHDPDKILVPSGENATDVTAKVCAFVSLNSPSASARQASRGQFWPRRCDFEGARRTRIPDFDRPISRSRHNLGPIRGKRNRCDVAAVGVRLLAEQLQFVCQASQQSSVLAKEGRFEGSGAPDSQTLIVLSHDPVTILVPSGENATELITSLWASVLSLISSSLPARQANKASVLAKEGRFEGSGAPESQTLIVSSHDPETILVPSGENATELMQLLWAFLFSLNSSSLSARQANSRQFWPRRGDFELAAHPNPRL